MTISEQRVQIPSQGLVLEGLLTCQPGAKAMVVTHPHPLYGGDMQNNVVAAVTKLYANAGYWTLRFNFRGVGASQGAYDNGRGEQHDVDAALTWLAGLGASAIDLVGYSFGAWVAALGAQNFQAMQRLILIAPPVSFLDFTAVRALPKLALVLVGRGDDIAGTSALSAAVPQWNQAARLRIIEGADHFFWGKTDAICREIKPLLS